MLRSEPVVSLALVSGALKARIYGGWARFYVEPLDILFVDGGGAKTLTGKLGDDNGLQRGTRPSPLAAL